MHAWGWNQCSQTLDEHQRVENEVGYERLDLVVLMVGASDVVNWLEQKTPATLERG